MKIISICLCAISIFLLINLSSLGVNGQISTACTSSMITSFTPCFSFITSSGSSSPTKLCCDSLKSFITQNVDCACLIVTGNVPLSIPFTSQNMAISLPRMCNDNAVPIQCKAVGAPLPPAGPALFAPPPPAIAPSAEAPAVLPSGEAPSPAPGQKRTKASKAVTLAPSPQADEWITEVPEASPSSEPLPPTAHSRIRPVLNPKSSSSSSLHMFQPSIILVLVAIIVLKF